MAAETKQSAALTETQAQPLREASKKKGVKKLLSMGGTFLTVAVLTGLLWVWADQAQLLEQDMDLAFTLATTAESRLIVMTVRNDSGEEALEAAGGGKLVEPKVTFEGTRSRLRELHADLHSGRLELFAYLSEPAYRTGTSKIPVADLLNSNEELRDRGVTVIETEPAEIIVVLDKWVLMKKVKLAVKDTGENRRFRANIDPPEIAVQMPASLRETLKLQPQPLLVELRQIPEPITSGRKVSGTVLTELAGHTVRPERPIVNVILQSIEEGTATVGPLQIYVMLPPEMIGSHIPEWQDEAKKVVEVEVVGPRAELDKLKTAAKDMMVKAYIDLSATHAEHTETYYTVPVQLWFSEDIHGVKQFGTAKTVKVRLRSLLEK